MRGSAIAQKVAYGYAKAGAVIGLPHALYRATSPNIPALSEENRLRSISFISSPSSDGAFGAPSKHGNPYRYSLIDTRAPPGTMPSAAVQPGDYIDGPTGTFLMLSGNADEICMAAECARTLTIHRPGVQTVISTQTGGQTATTPAIQVNEALYDGGLGGSGTTTTSGGGSSSSSSSAGGVVLASYPTAMFDGGRQQAMKLNLPGDVPIKGSMALLPAVPGLLIRLMDHAIDDIGRRWVVSGNELTDLGWRLTLIASES